MTTASDSAMAPKILLIEDNKDVRKLFSIIFDRAGMQVESIGDGREALERLDHEDLPDAVVMDRMLPGLPGDVILARMREHEAWQKVPIIIVSALRRRFDIKQLLNAGASAYLQKPVDTRELVSTVREAIQSSAQLGPLVQESLQSAIPRAPERASAPTVNRSTDDSVGNVDLVDP